MEKSIKLFSFIFLVVFILQPSAIFTNQESQKDNHRVHIAASIPRVREARVTNHRHAIAQSAYRGRLIVSGLKIGTVGFLAYGIWGVASLGNRLIQSLLKGSRLVAPAKLEQKERYTIEHIQASFPDLINKLNKVILLVQKNSTSDDQEAEGEPLSFLQDAVMYSLKMVGFSMISSLCMPYLEQLLFYDDLEWFLAKKTGLDHALEQLRVHALVIDSRAALPRYKVDYAVQALQDQLVDAIDQVERLLGFMEYLLERADKKKIVVPVGIKDAPLLIVRITNDFCVELHNKLQACLRDEYVTSLAEEVARFVADIKNNSACYKHFDLRLEHA